MIGKLYMLMGKLIILRIKIKIKIGEGIKGWLVIGVREFNLVLLGLLGILICCSLRIVRVWAKAKVEVKEEVR